MMLKKKVTADKSVWAWYFANGISVGVHGEQDVSAHGLAIAPMLVSVDGEADDTITITVDKTLAEKRGVKVVIK